MITRDVAIRNLKIEVQKALNKQLIKLQIGHPHDRKINKLVVEALRFIEILNEDSIELKDLNSKYFIIYNKFIKL